MTRSSFGSALGEFDVLGVATTCALVVGAFSLLAPFLSSLTGTLAALALAGWCSKLRPGGASVRGIVRPGRGIALAAFGGGVILFVGPLASSLFRGLVLGVAIVPLWFVEKRRPVPASASEERP
jgi:hypothetical protein